MRAWRVQSLSIELSCLSSQAWQGEAQGLYDFHRFSGPELGSADFLCEKASLLSSWFSEF